MLLRHFTGAVAALLALSLAPCALADDYVKHEVVVTIAPAADIDTVLRTYGASVVAKSSSGRSYRVAIDPLLDENTAAAAMNSDSRVISASPNYLYGAPEYSDDGFAEQWTSASQWTSVFNGDDGPVAYSGQFAIGQVNFQAAANKTSGTGVLVAVLDTGLSARHPGLVQQAVPGWNFVDNNADTDDQPAALDCMFAGHSNAAAGHGTMVSGIVARFAPGAQIMPIRVLNSDGFGTLWNIVEGIKYAAANHARVINLSLSFAHNSGALTNAVNEAWAAGAVIVCAAGNRNSQVPAFPAGNPHVLSVAGLDGMNVKAAFSNFGSSVDVCAPSVKIVSTYWDGTYVAWSGTSFAAPMAAAEAALIVSLAPGQRPNSIIQTIIKSSHSVNSVNPDYFNRLGKGGAGLIDFDAAVCGASPGKANVASNH